MEAISVVIADITTLGVGAIVNAANTALLGGGGVDGAIHRAAGPRLLEACLALPEIEPGVRCPTGEARITPGFDLPTGSVIHTVGPVWSGGEDGEDDLLRACYVAVMELVRARRIGSVAFPAISTGAYGFPVERAAGIAVAAIRSELKTTAAAVTFACFDSAIADAYRRRLSPSGGAG